MKIEEVYKIVDDNKLRWQEEKIQVEAAAKKIWMIISIIFTSIPIASMVAFFNIKIGLILFAIIIVAVCILIKFATVKGDVQAYDLENESEENAINNNIPKYIREYCNIVAKGVSSKLNFFPMYLDWAERIEKSEIKSIGDEVINYKNLYGEFESCSFRVGDINISETYKDSDGDTHTKEIFNGLIAECKLKKEYGFGLNIYAQKNTKKEVEKFKCRLEKVKLDSTEFEKYYEVYSDNSVETLQVLTADIMEELVDLRVNKNVGLDISLRNDTICIAIWGQKLFDQKMDFEHESVKKDYDNIKDVMKKIKYVMSLFNVLD